MVKKSLEDNLEAELHISNYIIIYKFILGVIELILGLGILFFSKQILEIYQHFKSVELLEDPHDLLVNILEKIIPYIFEHKGYVILILIVLGLVKIIGSLGLVYHKRWGLDILTWLTIALLPFDGFSLIAHPTQMKAVYFLVNIFIALYLVNFKPQQYFATLKRRVNK